MVHETVPSGFPIIEDWLLSYFYQHPKGDHSTVSLLRELDGILKAEPSGLEKYNKHQKLFNAAEVTAEEYEALRTPKLEEVQKAVETLIEGGWDADWGFPLSGEITASEHGPAWTRARSAIKRIEIGDFVVVSLRGHRVG